jgi:hypothetical protein
VTAPVWHRKSAPTRVWRTCAYGLIAAVALWSAACFNAKAPAVKGISFKSFLRISFGTSLRDTHGYYPSGINEASPMGFPAYHVTGLSADGISYPDVIYEFDGINGMQVVVAHFAPSSTDAVLERLRRILGEPTQHTLTQEQRMEEATWLTPGGEEVHFYRDRHLMTILGPQGANMRKDLQLRVENSSPVL